MASAVTMVLSGGVGLGAYQFGAYAAMDEDLRRRATWLAGASIGAVNAALIAGNPPERRIEALATFWDDTAAPVGPIPQSWWGAWRHGLSWLSVMQSRSLGRAGVFEHSPWPWLGGRATAVYDWRRSPASWNGWSISRG